MKTPEEAQLPYLSTFSKAAELNSFTAAAKALGLTQAAVSQRVHSLEKVLGRSLFQRRGGRVLLTEAGQKLYEYAQRILHLHREARQAITGHKTKIGGELLVAASSIPGERARIRHSPQNYPWAYEMKVEDPDGHVLRFGSEPRSDRPFDQWTG